MSNDKPQVMLLLGNQILEENAQVEWYSGSELHTHPVRIRLRGIWEDVFRYEKKIREDDQRAREMIFRCNIGDNRIIDVVVRHKPDTVHY